jgi:acetyl-CoA C-acetyltransferase
MQNVVITSAARTAIGKFEGSLKNVAVTQLGKVVVNEVLNRSKIEPKEVDELIMGQVLQTGCGSNSARQVQLLAGMPVSSTAYTVNKVCASGMKAVTLGALSIAAGENNVVVAGGMENMSSAPFILPKARGGYRLGNGEILDSIICDALTDPFSGGHMGITAENLAEKFDISRRDQDEFVTESQNKAGEAIKAGKFKNEIVPVERPQRRGDPISFDTDEFPRPDTTVEKLGKLKPAFTKDGTVTAGNSSGINDGAAAMVLMSQDEADRRNVKPMARILSYASVGVDPAYMGIGPVEATRLALSKADLKLSDIELFELNEAFAAQSLAVIKELKLDQSKINVNGGAIALGHPVGASGARIIVTLLHAMKDRDARLGLATLCVGGGQGMAMILERLN